MLIQGTMKALVCCSCLSWVSCVTVAPYEREHLSRPYMNVVLEAEESAFRAHVHDSREGATGGQDSTGGGCGCN